MKKLLKFLTSRTFLFIVLILLQLALLVGLLVEFSRVGSVLYLLLTILSVLVMLPILEYADINPAYKLMWLLLIIAMPLSGAVFYMLLGSRGIRPKKAAQFADIEHKAAAAIQLDGPASCALKQFDRGLERSVDYLSTYAASPVYQATQSRYFATGEDFFPVFLEELRKARRSVFMEYFIIEEGEMWNQTLELLKEKARQGLDVRVIYDGVGSMFTLPLDYDEQLRAAGVKCYAFNALHFSWHLTDYKMLNNRDHRKIAVIDGEIGFSGGLNFADEYINRKRRFGYWKDTAFMLKGPAVYSLTLTFLRMWDFVAGTDTVFRDYLPVTRFEEEQGFVQPYCDSPLDGENISENAYLNVLQQAKDYVYLTTPYLILDNEMLTSLCLAAKSGVDIRIITPGIPDKWYVYYVTQSYYATLLKAGVRIYEYTPGFIHAKMYLSDDKLAIVGSANMDYRSLYLHFENCCAFYGGHMPHDVKEDILQTMAASHEVTLKEALNAPLYKWVAQIFLRLFAPLM